MPGFAEKCPVLPENARFLPGFFTLLYGFFFSYFYSSLCILADVKFPVFKEFHFFQGLFDFYLCLFSFFMALEAVLGALCALK